ncbi:MAG: sugar phosphate isomerase/epimerase [Phycisphaerae bacterium]|nr:sugar phosphate isomerase/epimerase [Phycisphaerae bacterium]
MFHPRSLVVCQIVLGLVVSLTAARAEEKGAKANPFYALANGVIDDKHPTPESQARMLEELGYDGISYSGVEDLPERLAALDRHGLKMFTLYVGANLDPDQPKHDPRLLDVIKQLKGRDTMIWLYVQSKKFKPSSVEGDPRAVEIIRELADAAKASGLSIALYPHTWFWIERVEDAVRVVKKVGRDNVGVTFNLCHWLRVDKPETLEERLSLARPYLLQVTVNGADDKGDWDKLIQPLDQGTFDVARLLKMLKKLGHTGPVGLQCYGVKGDKYENLKRSMAAWKRLSAME